MGKFDKRTGTTDRGKDYEDYLVAFISLKLTKDDSVESFEISSNHKDFGAFDDIIVEVTFKDQTTQQYAIQTKHKQNAKEITKDQLAAQTGNFSIQKYFHSYQEIKSKSSKNFSYVLFTSASFNDEKHFKLENIEVTASKQDLQQPNFVNTSECDYSYRLATTDGANPYAEFFQKFHFYPNQKKADEIKVLVSELFKSSFSNEDLALHGFVKFIQDWSQQEGRKKCLNKRDVMTKIGNLMIRPFLRTSLVFKTEPQLKPFKELCLKYDVTVLDKCEKSEEIFKEKIKDSEDSDELIIVKTSNSEEVKEVNNGISLILKSSEAHFLLIGEDVDTDNLQDFKIFNSLAQDDEMCEKFGRLEVSLQDRAPVLLSKILEDDDEMSNLFTANKLFEISLNTLKIGETAEELPVPYIKQVVIKKMIKFNFLHNVTTSSLCVVSCPSNKIEQLKSQLGSRFLSIDDYLPKREDHPLRQEFIKCVIVAENLCSIEDFHQICSQNPNTICHHFRWHSNGHLEWFASNGSVQELIKHQVPQCAFPECEIIAPSNHINVLCSKSGTGKSVMLKYLKNNLPSTYWTLYVRISDHLSFFKESQNSQELLQKLLQHQAETFQYSSFEMGIRERFVHKKKLIILWDGIDEVGDIAIVQRIAKTIYDVSASGFISWVTSRHYFPKIFINLMCTFPIRIQDLTKEKQEVYIREFLLESFAEDQIKDIVVKITNLLAATDSIKLLGIPLHLYILGHLFCRNPEKYGKLIQSTFTLADMIRYFVKESINLSYLKRDIDINADSWTNTLKESRRFKLRQYELCALQTHLSTDDLAKLPQIALSDHRKVVEDECGILTSTGANGYTFFHNSCGEYFVASWFATNFRDIPNFQEILFEDRYRNIRLMFDIILSKQCPLHLAILHRNFDAIFNKDAKDINTVDDMGRTPLHLACSYGQTHPPLFIKSINGCDIIDFDKGETVQEKNYKYKETINFLLNRCSFSSQDMYQWSCLKYALVTFSLYAIEAILKHDPNAYDPLEADYGAATLVFYSVKFNYQNIFDRIGNLIPYFEDEQSCNILHQISRWSNRSRFLRKIFKNKKYIKAVNRACCIRKMTVMLPVSFDIKHTTDFETEIEHGTDYNEVLTVIRETPLHFASLFGNYETVEILTEYGADVNCLNNGRYVPLHYAASTAQVRIVKFLVERGAVLNKLNFYKENELHLAVKAASKEIVRYLLEKGSRIVANNEQVTSLDASLDVAIGTQQHEIVVLLLNHLYKYAESLQNISTKEKIFLLHVAVSCDKFSIVEKLKYYGFIADKPDINGLGPLHWACKCGYLDVVELLIAHESGVNSKDHDGWSPLHHAIFKRQEEIMKLLLENGAKIDNQDKLGRSPLYYAVAHQLKDVSNFLVRNGADLHKEDNEKISPLNLRRIQLQHAHQRAHIQVNVAVNMKFTIPRLGPLERICSQGYVSKRPNNI